LITIAFSRRRLIEGLCHQYARIVWSLVIIIPCLLGTAGMTPALAWGGMIQAGPARGMGHGVVWGGPRLPRQGHSRYGVPGRSWPSGPYTSADVPAFQDETPVSPEVIVLTSSPPFGAPPAMPPAQMDFGYVPGCRAIPNGYHCDPQPHEGQAN
jgi:hypothetical protein